MWKQPRRYSTFRTNIILVLIFLNVIAMYHQIQQSVQPIESELGMEQGTRFLKHEETAGKRSMSSCSPSGVRIVLGPTRLHEQVSLVIGISTVRRSRGDYLFETLNSLFKHLPADDSSIIVIVYVADIETSARNVICTKIEKKFTRHLNMARIQVIEACTDIYPIFETLPVTYGDGKERLAWRAKQALDFAFLWDYARLSGKYYLHLEDDVLSSPGFVQEIWRAVRTHGGYGGSWVCLEFSRLGFIGKMYRTKDLTKLLTFVRVFFDRHPVDFLMRYFNSLMGQESTLLHSPSLFQHIGYNSSLSNKIQPLKDSGYIYETNRTNRNNPPAELFTTITEIGSYTINLAYSESPGYFWGKAPRARDLIHIVFNEPVKVKQINIRTGSKKHPQDILYGGYIEGSSQLINISQGGMPKKVYCHEYVYLGAFEKGQLQLQDIGLNFPLHCLRVSVTEDQTYWLLIEEIRVYNGQ